MPFILRPGVNPIIRAAWAGLRAQEKKEKKGAEPEKAKPAPKAAKKVPAKKARRK